uniref:Uncharacterized protein n=1 Tax=Eutreptiella gymnastica TaxID=73025 RepID=A0A7S4LJE4_9EUGL
MSEEPRPPAMMMFWFELGETLFNTYNAQIRRARHADHPHARFCATKIRDKPTGQKDINALLACQGANVIPVIAYDITEAIVLFPMLKLGNVAQHCILELEHSDAAGYPRAVVRLHSDNYTVFPLPRSRLPSLRAPVSGRLVVETTLG